MVACRGLQIISPFFFLSKQIRPHSKVGALPAGGPGHVPGNAEAAVHERTGTYCEAVRSVQTGAPH